MGVDRRRQHDAVVLGIGQETAAQAAVGQIEQTRNEDDVYLFQAVVLLV